MLANFELSAKKEKYLSLRNEILSFDYNIDEKVNMYKDKLVQEAELDRKQKLEKVDNYLEIIDELINENNELTDEINENENKEEN